VPRASSARQYLSIYTRFRAELGRPPLVGEVTVDAIAGYSRELERHGGRAGGPCAPATRRAHLIMLRALLKELGLEHRAGAARVPSHRSGPPATLTPIEYGNLIRAPDQRSTAGKRDVALLRLFGECGLRNLDLLILRLVA
jgi:integrase